MLKNDATQLWNQILFGQKRPFIPAQEMPTAEATMMGLLPLLVKRCPSIIFLLHRLAYMPLKVTVLEGRRSLIDDMF